jgi:hypothetical protein
LVPVHDTNRYQRCFSDFSIDFILLFNLWYRFSPPTGTKGFFNFSFDFSVAVSVTLYIYDIFARIFNGLLLLCIAVLNITSQGWCGGTLRLWEETCRKKRAGGKGRKEKGERKRAGEKGREEKGGKKRAGGKGQGEKGGKTIELELKYISQLKIKIHGQIKAHPPPGGLEIRWKP